MTDIPAKIEPDLSNVAPTSGKIPEIPAISAFHPAFSKSLFFGPSQPPWSALEDHPAAVLVKQGLNRKVWKVPLSGGQIVFAKVFDQPPGSLAHYLKVKLRVHPAFREWLALCALQARDVPSVCPIALTSYKASQSYPARIILLTEGVDNSAALTQVWREQSKPGASPRTLHSITTAAAALWAQAHNEGYAHPDGHPGNVLVWFSPHPQPAEPHCCFVDPAFSFGRRVRRHALSWQSVLRSLAMLDQFFHRTATRTQRLRFWRQYWTYRKVLLDDQNERRLLARLAQTEALHRLHLARQWDRRLRGDGKYFAKIRLPNRWRATVMLRPERPHVWPDAHFASRTAQQWTALLANWLTSNRPQALASEKIRFVQSPERRRSRWGVPLFQHAHRLRHRDLSAPLVLGCLYHPGILGIRDEYLILPN